MLYHQLLQGLADEALEVFINSFETKETNDRTLVEFINSLER